MHKKVSTVILILAAAVFVFSGIQLARIGLEYRKGTSEYEKLAEELQPGLLPPAVPADFQPETSVFSDGEEPETEAAAPAPATDPSVSLNLGHQKLKEINSDYVGWLAMNDTINYPVVQGNDNAYYLTHTFYGTRNKAGTLFLDADNADGWSAKNVIVYGHNLKNDKMFGTLMNYADPDYAKQHLYFSVYTQEGVTVYGIFAAYETGEVSEAYQYGFTGDEDFMRYIELVRSWSVIDTDIQVGKDDQIITLSTCTNVNNGRFIVQGKRIQ